MTMGNQLEILNSLAGKSTDSKDNRMSPIDAVGEGEIRRAEAWEEANSSLPKVAKWAKFKEEFLPTVKITDNNKSAIKQMEWRLHPDGPNAALESYKTDIYRNLEVRDDFEKETYLRDIAREAPREVLDEMLINLSVTNAKITEKTRERSRIANVQEFLGVSENFANRIYEGKERHLNPEVSISSHSEDLWKVYTSGKSEYLIDNDGRISITDDRGELVPAWSLKTSDHLTWEEEAINYHDLIKPAKNVIKPLLALSRREAKQKDQMVTMQLLDKVDTLPREFRSNIIVDAAVLTPDPINTTRETIKKLMSRDTQAGMYRSQRDVTRALFKHWSDLSTALDGRIENSTIPKETKRA